MIRRFVQLALAMLVPLAAHAGGANLVTNGSFSTDDFSGWTLTPALVGSDILVYPHDPSGDSGPSPTPEQFWFGASKGFDDTLSQTLVTTAGATYDLSFDLYMSAAGPGDFSASIDGTPLLSLTNSPGSNSWVEYEFAVTAPTSNTVLSFSGQNVPNWNGVTAIDFATPVPEPSTYAMILAGLGMIGFVVFKRRRPGGPISK